MLLLISAAFSVLMGIQGISRYVTYHNQTYDLALYARQAWGLVHGVYWDPVVNAHFLGTHCAFVLWPLGMLGQVVGIVPVLLVAQVLAFGLTTLPLAQLAARRFFRPNGSADVPEHRFPGHLWHWDGPPLAWGPISRLGADNEYVFRQVLGLDDAEWAALDAEGHLNLDYVDAEGKPL